MTEQFDFERYWLTKFGNCIEATGGADVRQQIMDGSQILSDDTPRAEVITWTQGAMKRLESLLDEDQLKQVMTGCACQYPKESLQEMRRSYAETGDIRLVHQMLLDQFKSFLQHSLELPNEMITDILARGWGAAGILEENRIIATKIPKSGYLRQYMEETDPGKKRALYCHCPRVRDVLKSGEELSTTYCYCGAGFYKGMWEEILQQPLEVELLQSVLKGDEVCQVAVHLP
jgi:predicted hydrocarbon binding protein